MSFRRTAWHPTFARLLTQRCPRGLRIEVEVTLSQEPQRADILLLESTEARDDRTAAGFRALWPLIPSRALLEFKSRRRPFESGDFCRLLGYAGQYLARELACTPLHPPDSSRVGPVRPGDLALVLVVTHQNAASRAELCQFDLSLRSVQPGYELGRLGPFPVVLVDLGVVAEVERDGIAGYFVRTPPDGDDAWVWAIQNVFGPMEVEMNQLEGYEEMIKEGLRHLPPELILEVLSPEQRLAGLPPEQRLAGLPPEQRLAGLPPEQRLAGLPPEQRLAGLSAEQRLAGLTPEQLDALAKELQARSRG